MTRELYPTILQILSANGTLDKTILHRQKNDMTNQEKAKLIAAWVNPAERITVDFNDTKGLNAEVSGCTDQVVYLAFQEAFPHMKEQVVIPLRDVQVEEDHGHYTRDPDAPLQWRLRLRVNQNRPEGW